MSKVKPMSTKIYGMLKAACEGRLPDIREVNNVQLRACLDRGWFILRARSVQVTAEGMQAYEEMKRSDTPLRAHIGPLARTVLEFAEADLQSKLIEFGNRLPKIGKTA